MKASPLRPGSASEPDVTQPARPSVRRLDVVAKGRGAVGSTVMGAPVPRSPRRRSAAMFVVVVLGVILVVALAVTAWWMGVALGP